MKEKLKFEVTVDVEYDDKEDRKRAIKKSKECLLSVSILGSTSVKPKKVKLIK